MRLLVVEDDGKMAALLRRGLGERGAAVDVAAGVVAQLRDAGVDVRWVPGCTRERPELYSYNPRLDGFTLKVLDKSRGEVARQEGLPAPKESVTIEMQGGGAQAVIRRASMIQKSSSASRRRCSTC